MGRGVESKDACNTIQDFTRAPVFNLEIKMELVLLEPVPENKKYRLLHPVLIDIKNRDIDGIFCSKHLIVPAYFEYDGASVPFFGWLATTTPFDPRVMKAALAHDWLYHTHNVWDRKAADLLFYKLLRENNLSYIKSKLMYWAVRIASWPYWKNDQEDYEKIKDLINKNIEFSVKISISKDSIFGFQQQ